MRTRRPSGSAARSSTHAEEGLFLPFAVDDSRRGTGEHEDDKEGNCSVRWGRHNPWIEAGSGIWVYLSRGFELCIWFFSLPSRGFGFVPSIVAGAFNPQDSGFWFLDVEIHRFLLSLVLHGVIFWEGFYVFLPEMAFSIFCYGMSAWIHVMLLRNIVIRGLPCKLRTQAVLRWKPRVFTRNFHIESAAWAWRWTWIFPCLSAVYVLTVIGEKNWKRFRTMISGRPFLCFPWHDAKTLFFWSFLQSSVVFKQFCC